MSVPDYCCVDGCERRSKFGYVACRKHVRERERLLRRVGCAAVAMNPAWLRVTKSRKPPHPPATPEIPHG